jgi:hypothetical protein
MNESEFVHILDRSAVEKFTEPTDYFGDSGAPADRVLAGRQN